MLALKTAKAWGDQPLDHIAPGLRSDFDPRVRAKLNQRLKMAYQLLEDETCQECGVPVWIGHSIDSAIQFKVHQTKCYGCEAKDGATRRGKKDPGSSEWVEIDMEKGSTLPSRLEGYALFEDMVIAETGADYDDEDDDDEDGIEGGIA